MQSDFVCGPTIGDKKLKKKTCTVAGINTHNGHNKPQTYL